MIIAMDMLSGKSIQFPQIEITACWGPETFEGGSVGVQFKNHHLNSASESQVGKIDMLCNCFSAYS